MKSSVHRGAVVAGVDGSNGSDMAVRWAATFAAAHRRPLAVVHGAGTPECFGADFPVDTEQVRLCLLATGRTGTQR